MNISRFSWDGQNLQRQRYAFSTHLDSCSFCDMLYPLRIFAEDEIPADSATLTEPTYWYTGICPQQQVVLRLPRTTQAETVARRLMAQLAAAQGYSCEGKMYGILLVRTVTGEVGVLKAFSGLLNGCSEVNGWVPPIPGRDRISVAEAQTLAELDAIKQELMQLSQLPARQQLDQLTADFTAQLRSQAERLCDRKQRRHQLRQQFQATLSGDDLTAALADLNRQSQQDGIARRRLKQQRDAALQPLQDEVNAADAMMRQLKQQRKQISRRLQAQMHAAYQLTNFAGESASLDQLMSALPTGTGDCCAPKLLHYAATHGLKPLAMAEFWWDGTFDADIDRGFDTEAGRDSGSLGSNLDDSDNALGSNAKRSGRFYGACAERCQPIMGFLLSGLSQFTDAVVCPHPKSLSHRERDFEQFLCSKKGSEGNGQTAATTDSPISKSAFFNSALALDIVYEDTDLMVVNKPAGLLSVPGRYFHNQDSVLSRLRCHYGDAKEFNAAHRLDQDTSGVLLIARHAEALRHLQQQFQQRHVQKRYVAVLAGQLTAASGVIELPLRTDLANRPRQVVDWQQGKPCVTKFQVLNHVQKAAVVYTQVELCPVTGRTHQLRVHAAAPEGLNAPIVGDRIYGTNHYSIAPERLYLHAQSLHIRHPRTGAWLCLDTPVPWPDLVDICRTV